MAPKKTALSSAQKKVLRAAASALDRAYADALRTLAAAGIDRDNDSTRCLLPPRGHCASFKQPVRGFRCARPRCGHPFSRHNVF
jgi:hypothetical protein